MESYEWSPITVKVNGQRIQLLNSVAGNHNNMHTHIYEASMSIVYNNLCWTNISLMKFLDGFYFCHTCALRKLNLNKILQLPEIALVLNYFFVN